MISRMASMKMDTINALSVMRSGGVHLIGHRLARSGKDINALTVIGKQSTLLLKSLK